MTEAEYKAIYERLSSGDTKTYEYFDPMMSPVHVVTVDSEKQKLIPMLSKDCEKMDVSEKIQCISIEKCMDTSKMDYAEALLLLGDEYIVNIQSYMDYGRFVSGGLYPVRFDELKALAWMRKLDSDIVTICRDDKDYQKYNYVHVCKNGYVKRTDSDGNQLFDPVNDWFCFLIDLEFADFIRRKMQKEEWKNTANKLKSITPLSYERPIVTGRSSNNQEKSRVFSQTPVDFSETDSPKSKEQPRIRNIPTMVGKRFGMAHVKPNLRSIDVKIFYPYALPNIDDPAFHFIVNTQSEDMQEKVCALIKDEFINMRFGELSERSIEEMLISFGFTSEYISIDIK